MGCLFMRKRKIVIAEDHTILREGLRALLSSAPDLEVIGEAKNGLDAIRCVETMKPDLVLMDLSMPRTSGMDAIREIKKRFPDTKILKYRNLLLMLATNLSQFSSISTH